jgi:DNA-binding FrmR family transcriptional regulator
VRKVKQKAYPPPEDHVILPGGWGIAMAHHTHPDIVRRLKRAGGHLNKIIGMIEDGAPCLDLAQQLQAVENAIDNAKKTLIHDHIDHCLNRSVRRPGRSGRAALAEFKRITKYL